jgi:hypothetical protein
VDSDRYVPAGPDFALFPGLTGSMRARTEADILELTVELPDGTLGDLTLLVGEEGGRAVVVGFQ